MQQKVGELGIAEGDKIIGKNGVAYRILDFKLGLEYPGGGYFQVLVQRPGIPSEKGRLTFQELLEAQEAGVIERIEHIEQEKNE